MGTECRACRSLRSSTHPGLVTTIRSRERCPPRRRGKTLGLVVPVLLLLLACVAPSHGSNSSRFSSSPAAAVGEGVAAMVWMEKDPQQQQQRQQLIETLEALLALERSRQTPPSSPPPSSSTLLAPSPSKDPTTTTALPMQNMHLRVGVVVDPPLVIRSIPYQGREAKQQETAPRYTGIVMDIIKSHSELLGFSYTIVTSEDGLYGEKLPNGSYSGVMGLFTKKGIDVMYSGLAITTDRSQVVSFTQPFYQSGLKILVPRAKGGQGSAWFILQPFAPHLWAVLLATVVGISSIFYLIDRLSPYGKRLESKPSWVFHSFGVLLSIDDFVTVNHHGIASSLLTVAWFFVVLVIITLYTANMMSFLTVSRMSSSIASLGDIANRNAPTGMVAATFGTSWVQGNLPAFGSLVHELKSAGDVIDALRHGTLQAAILKAPVADYFAGNSPCDVASVGQAFATNFYAVGVQPGSPHFPLLNQMVIDQVANGEIEKITGQWLKDSCAAAAESAEYSGSGRLGILQVRGVFYILAVGVCLSLLCLVYQVVCYRLVLRRLGQTMLRHDVDDEQLIHRITGTTTEGGGGPVHAAILVTRHAKLVLRKLGVSKHDINVVIAAVDHNGDGFLDVYDLSRLQSIFRSSRAALEKQWSPYSLDVMHQWVSIRQPSSRTHTVNSRWQACLDRLFPHRTSSSSSASSGGGGEGGEEEEKLG